MDIPVKTPFKKRFSVAQKAEKKRSLDISRLSICPPQRLYMINRKFFEKEYVEYLTESLTSLVSLKDKMGIMVEIMSLYNETNKPGAMIYLTTSNNFVGTLPFIVDSLNTFFHKNHLIIDSMYKMLYGEVSNGENFSAKKLATTKDLTDAEEKVDTLSALVEETT